MEAMRAQRTQCEKCPWKVSTNPREIPNGYDVEKHQRLQCTIVDESNAIEKFLAAEPMRIMACHRSPVGRELPCVGWLHNQLGEGNNIALRYAVRQGRINADCVVVGPQHARFEDTLPEDGE